MDGDDSSDDDRSGSNIGGMKRIEADIKKMIQGIKTNHHLQDAFFDKVDLIKKKQKERRKQKFVDAYKNKVRI